MSTRFMSLGRRLGHLAGARSAWIILVMVILLTLLHYTRPAVVLFPGGVLEWHGVERIIFLLPVAGATFAFGRAGGLLTLGLAMLIMLPRVIWVSASPAGALLEVLAVGAVGYLVTWIITTQEREKQLRQEAVSRLRTINAIGVDVSKSLDLDQILNSALDKVLEVNQVKMGYIFLVERGTQDLVLTAHRGVPACLTTEFERLRPNGTLSGRVAQTGKPTIVGDLLKEKRMLPSLAGSAGMRSFVAIPLMARDRVVGVMDLADPQSDCFSAQDVECLTSVGTGIGVAIENAYLYHGMRHYAQQITRAQERERARIARELHDETTQSLIVLSRQLEALAKADEAASPARARRLRELQRIANDVIQGVRRFSRDLRPSTLDDLGLLPTLESLAITLTEQDGIPTGLWVTGERRRLPGEVELALFRIAQEALNNVKKHAEATQVIINVEFTEGAVTMTVQDNGKGFELATPTEVLAAPEHLGLIGMHERAYLLGGTLVIESHPNIGTKVVVTMPDAPTSASDRNQDGPPPE